MDTMRFEGSEDALTTRMPRAEIAASSIAHEQATLASPIACRGIGLHSGAPIRMEIRPAPANNGVTFHRSDLDAAPIAARYDAVIDTRLSTVIGNTDGARVATVEHLMAALHACGIDNAQIDIDGPEVPALDGSSAEFCFLIACAGRVTQGAARKVLRVLRRVRVEDGDAFAELRPAPRAGLSLALSIDFAAPAIGQQNFAMRLTHGNFMQEVASCRTFAQRHEIDALQAAGLARGGSLDNAIVVDGERILNPTGLRIKHEFVRHKLLDAVGDLYLAGHTLQAGFIGHKSGHGLNNRLLRTLMADPHAWTLAEDGARPGLMSRRITEAA